MKLEGKSAFVTGGGSGIGRALCLELAEHGCRITVVDLNRQQAQNVARQVTALGVEVSAASLDIRNEEAMHEAFEGHLQKFKTLDIVCLNAGVVEKGDLLSTSGEKEWEEALDIDLKAQITGTLQAVHAMETSGSKGTLLFTASAGGVFPMPAAPVYAAAKSGLIHFARSLGPRLAKRGIKVCTICPQVVDTPLVTGIDPEALQLNARSMPSNLSKTMLSASKVAACGVSLIKDDANNGTVLLIHATGRTYEVKNTGSVLKRRRLDVGEGLATRPGLPAPQDLAAFVEGDLPSHVQRVQVYRLSNDFRAATKLVAEPMPEIPAGHVLVRRAYAGVNASDVNFTAGRYFGSPEQSQKLLPFYAGFEAVGVVARTGSGVKGLKVGDCVAEMTYGAFSEWGAVSEKHALPVPTCCPEVVALLTSGLTASIGLEVAGKMSTDETVLVTAAAGGTGQFVVQLAKSAGNHVIATCGSQEKAALLKKLGADRVINYKEENLKDVLRKEYAKGVNLIWESVGGQMFQTCVRALANNGRLVIIGMMSQYGSGWKPLEHKGLPELLLQRSASVSGFFLPQHSRLYKQHLGALANAWTDGRLQVQLDSKSFVGVDEAANAVEHLQKGASVGKVTIRLSEQQIGQNRQLSRL